MEIYSRSKNKTYNRTYTTDSPPNDTRLGRVVSTIYNSVTFTDTIQGFKNPKWRSAIKHGNDAGTGSLVDKTVLEETPANAYYSRIDSIPPWWTPDTYTTYQYGQILDVNIPPISSSLDSSVYNAALTKLVKKAYDQTVTFEGGTFLAEAREALHMIRNPANGLLNLFKHFPETAKDRARRLMRQRNVPTKSRVAQANKYLSELWLEKQWGWQPLVSDLQSGVAALNNAMVGRSSRFTAAASSKDDMLHSDTQFTSTYAGNSVFAMRAVTKQETSCRVKAGFQVSPNGGKSFDANDFGLGPKNWIPTIWEVIPYSWLVDYFSNVSEVINAHAVLNHYFVWGSSTFKRNSYRYVSGWPNIPASQANNPVNWRGSGGTPGTMRTTRFQLERANMGRIDIRPQIELPHDWYKIGNLYSVLSAGRSASNYIRSK